MLEIYFAVVFIMMFAAIVVAIIIHKRSKSFMKDLFGGKSDSPVNELPTTTFTISKLNSNCIVDQHTFQVSTYDPADLKPLMDNTINQWRAIRNETAKDER